MTDGWARYRRFGTVTATRLTTDLTWDVGPVDDGAGSTETLTGRAGDWRVEDASGGVRTVADERFRATHRHLEGDRWERCSEVDARRSAGGETVQSLEGPVTSSAGDWIVREESGNSWPVPDDHFRSTYVRVGA
ncbi:hypothetical protein AB0P16_11880 [Dietzia maris]|uniref:hypothetical protein n=1 Tax=Dietzia maris TaxID=37915 RepID=UPI00343A1A1A